jgi:uncharacterized membrane protein
LYVFVVYSQTMIWNAKTLQEWTICVATHYLKRKFFFFFSMYPLNYDSLYYGIIGIMTFQKRDVQMTSTHLNKHIILYVKKWFERYDA